MEGWDEEFGGAGEGHGDEDFGGVEGFSRVRGRRFGDVDAGEGRKGRVPTHGNVDLVVLPLSGGNAAGGETKGFDKDAFGVAVMEVV